MIILPPIVSEIHETLIKTELLKSDKINQIEIIDGDTLPDPIDLCYYTDRF